MKKHYLNWLLVPVLVFAISTGAMAQSQVPLLRSWSWDHLYTTSAAEQASAQAIGYGNYQGQLDEVRIWNVARSATDIQSGLQRRLSRNRARWPRRDCWRGAP